jgi:GT2 family glycosyltransferase
MRPSVSSIVTTYNQPETLRLVLLALARQSLLPDEVLIADDGSSAETALAIQDLAPALPFPIVHVFQPDHGFRAARSRNNAIFESRGELLTFLDQDTLPRHDWLKTFVQRVSPGNLGLGRILDLELPAEGKALTAQDISSGVFESMHGSRQWASLIKRHRKFLFYGYLRRIGLGIKAKPKLRSCNFAAFRADLFRANGFDEEFVGWGQEDDDLARRLYTLGIKPVVLLRQAIVYHIPHPPRGTQEWSRGHNIARLNDQSRAAFCRHGIDAHPHEDVTITRIGST